MVADNLVHRKPDPRDRRGVLVHLTDRGLALQARLSERDRGRARAASATSTSASSPPLLDSLGALVERLR